MNEIENAADKQPPPPLGGQSSSDNEIILYQPDSTLTLDVRLENETVWLTQAQMTDLFLRDRTVITRHINNIFKEKELDEKSNVHFLHIANSDKPIKIETQSLLANLLWIQRKKVASEYLEI